MVDQQEVADFNKFQQTGLKNKNQTDAFYITRRGYNTHYRKTRRDDVKKVALINDMSGFGKCSLTAAIPVISAMGIQACPLPTAILSAQTGFDSFFCDDYTDRMNTITDEWVKLGVTFEGIYSGYLGSSNQIKNVLYFLEKFKKDETIFIADPVMGDNGRRIKVFSDKLLDTMKALTRKADVITPNLTEACLLADYDYEMVMKSGSRQEMLDRIVEVSDAIQDMAETRQTVIITGVVLGKENSVGNFIYYPTKEKVFYESAYTGKSFSGTGDLFASVVTGMIINGHLTGEAVKKAMTFLQPAIEEATRDGVEANHGVAFEKYLGLLMK